MHKMMNFNYKLCLAMLLALLKTTSAGLYTELDDVFILTNENFYENVLQSEKIWNVEFYNSWCGHCIHFAPTYKELATDLKGWTSVVQTAAMDCAEKENMDICRKYVDRGYPTMRLLGPYLTINDTGPEYVVRTVGEIETVLTEYLTNLTLWGVAPPSWPNLLPLVTVEAIWNEVKERHQHLVLIFEKEESLVGRQVILDMSGYHNVLVRRMTKKKVAKYGVKHFPSMFVVMRDGRFKEIAQGMTERHDFSEVLINMLKAEFADTENQEPQLPQHKVAQEKKNHNPGEPVKSVDEEQASVKEGVYMQDLESTLTYCFRQEIAINREIEGDKLEALKKFLKILLKHFPGRDEVMNFLLKINVWLSKASYELTGIHWVHNIDSLQTVDAFLPETIQWMGCHGSKPQYRGYPCGMWTLFHTLTVNAYQTGKNSPKHNYMEVLQAIKGYMEHFFGCSVCSSHFLKMAQSIDEKVQSPKDSMLWLWEAHNQANKRLSGDVSEDPKHKKLSFPPPSLCPECRTSESEGSKWRKDKVLEFLLNFYGADHIVQIEEETDEDYNANYFNKKDKKELDWWEKQQRGKDLEKIRDLRKQKREKAEEKKKASIDMKAKKKKNRKYDSQKAVLLPQNGSGWVSHADMGLCAMFYLLCLIIILVFYYHFTVRRKNNMFKHCPRMH